MTGNSLWGVGLAVKQRYGETGATLLELLITVIALAIILIAVPISFKGGTQVWDKGDRHAETLQNALIGMEYMSREVRQARYVTNVSAPDNTSGYIEFKYKDGGGGKYQLYQATEDYLQYAWSNDKDAVLADSLEEMAGPVAELTFDCYKYMNGALTQIDHSIADPDEREEELRKIRLVKVQMSTYDDDGKVNDIPLSSWIYLRGWSASRVDQNFAIFGNNGVDIGDQNTIVGDTYPSNIGANGDIIIGNKLDFRSGETHHGGGGNLIIDPPGNDTLGDNPDYGYDEIILMPCVTDFDPWNSGVDGPIDVAQGETRDIAPGSYTSLDIRNDGAINLSSGYYYFESITADNNVTMNFDVTGGDIEVYIQGRVVIGNTLTNNILADVTGGGAENVYFETHHETLDHTDKSDDAWSMGGNAKWKGTIYAPFGDIGVTDGIIEGQLIAGGLVEVHGGDPGPIPGYEPGYTYIDFVLSNHIRYHGYDCYDEDW